jgi:hypothetical protein
MYRSGGSSLSAIRVSGKSNLIYAAAICTDRLIIIIRSDCIRPVINGEPENSVPAWRCERCIPWKTGWNFVKSHARAYIYTPHGQKSIKWKKVKILGAFLIGARDKAQRAETLAEALYQPINCLNLIYCFPRRGFINTQTDTYTRLSR